MADCVSAPTSAHAEAEREKDMAEEASTTTPTKPLWKRKRVLIPAALAGLVGLAGVADTSEDDASTTTEAAAVTTTEAASETTAWPPTTEAPTTTTTFAPATNPPTTRATTTTLSEEQIEELAAEVTFRIMASDELGATDQFIDSFLADDFNLRSANTELACVITAIGDDDARGAAIALAYIELGADNLALAGIDDAFEFAQLLGIIEGAFGCG